jgi:DNA-binding NarL/FixJ family response regulator
MRELSVLLLGKPSLLSDGVMQILQQAAQVKLIGHWFFDDPVLERLDKEQPDIVLMIESEGDCTEEIRLTSQILERYVDLHVIRIGYVDSILRIFSSHALPATEIVLHTVILGTSTHI